MKYIVTLIMIFMSTIVNATILPNSYHFDGKFHCSISRYKNLEKDKHITFSIESNYFYTILYSKNFDTKSKLNIKVGESYFVLNGSFSDDGLSYKTKSSSKFVKLMKNTNHIVLYQNRKMIDVINITGSDYAINDLLLCHENYEG